MKQLHQCFFVQVGPDDAQAAGIVGAAVAHIDLAGHIVKLEPFAKGILQNAAGEWFQFDYVPGEIDIREGSADYTGRLCVIGADLNEKALMELFHL